jgi:phosphoglycerol transferase
MNLPAPRQPRWQAAGAYLAAVLLCLLLLTWVLELWRADLRVPFAYTGDAMFYHLVVKGMLDHGWYLENPALGLPTGLDLRDVPTSDHQFFLLLIKLATFFTSDYALIVNLFFLLSFPLTALSALYVLRRFHLSALPALLASLLYAFLPFHFGRGLNHLFLSAYYLVPLMVMVILWIGTEQLSAEGESPSRSRLRLRRPKLIWSLMICLLIASAGTYYAYFAAFFLLIAGLMVAARRKSLRPLMLPGLLVTLIAAVTVVNLLPSIIYLARHGDTPIVRRNVADAEVYGLKVAQLLLPVSGHRLYRVAQFKGIYNLRPFVNENDDSALGLVGSGGWLLLLGWLFYQPLAASRPEPEARSNLDGARGLLSQLSWLNAAAVLLATVGGFGALVSLIISPKIRAYNRISIYIAFFALFAVALLLEHISRRYFSGPGRQAVFGGLLALALVAGVWDQTSPRFIPDYERLQAEHRQDAEFVSQLEAKLPPGAMVFQLPVASFPEHPKIHKLNDYDLAKGYLHSRQLRWSYGAIKQRESDVWQKLVAAKPAKEMVETLALAGFSGLYLDRFGYADNGAQLEAELAGLLGAPPLVSANERLAFFDLSPAQQRLRETYSAPEWEARRDEALHPLLLLWQNGFSDAESTPEKSWRWCANEGRLEIVNRSPHPRRVTLETTFAAGRTAQLRIESALFSEQLPINFAGVPYTKPLTIPPGTHTIHFFCDAPRILAPLDSRIIVFRVENFRLRAEP